MSDWCAFLLRAAQFHVLGAVSHHILFWLPGMLTVLTRWESLIHLLMQILARKLISTFAKCKAIPYSAQY